MPGFTPSSGIGTGFTSLVWMIALIIVATIVWRGRKNHVPGTTIVLKRFRINEDCSAKIGVEIVGRASGLVAWILTLLRLEPEVELVVSDAEVTLRVADLSGIGYTYIPLGQIHATVCGYQRSILAFGFAILFSLGFVLNFLTGLWIGNSSEIGSDMAYSFAFLILAAIAALVYFLSKRIAISVETEKTRGIVFKRSVIENVSVDLPEAQRAITVINSRLLAAQSLHRAAPQLHSQRTVAVAPASATGSGACPKCSSLNPVGTRFCENCGSPLSA